MSGTGKIRLNRKILRKKSILPQVLRYVNISLEKDRREQNPAGLFYCQKSAGKEGETMAENENKITGVNPAETVKSGCGMNNNLQALPKSTEGLSEEEKQRIHDIRVAGGIARGKQRREQRDMREQARIYLQALISKEQAKEYLGEIDAETLSEEDLTVQGIMIAKMAQAAMKDGNAKAAEFVRDTSGQRPKDLVEVSGNVITDADRALMANLNKRLCKLTEKNDAE